MNLKLAALVVAAIAGFALFWMAIVWLVGALSGWRALASHYRTDLEFNGSWRSIRRARLGFASYKGVIRAGVDPVGIHFAPMALFRIGHPRLFIPWSDIRYEVVPAFFGKWGVLTFMRVPNVKLHVTEGDAEALFEARARGGM